MIPHESGGFFMFENREKMIRIHEIISHAMSRISIRFARPEFETHVKELLDSLHIVPKNPDLYTLACVHR